MVTRNGKAVMCFLWRGRQLTASARGEFGRESHLSSRYKLRVSRWSAAVQGQVVSVTN